MRLLEFNKDEGGANPRRPATHSQPRKATAAAVQTMPAAQRRVTRHKPGRPAERVFPVNGNTLPKPAPQSPVDLEQLQQRIVVLEQRLQEVSGKAGKASVKELQQLQQRIYKLETSLDSELWQARQREHTMLEMLAKPTLKTRIRQRISRFISTDIPAIGRLLKRGLHGWWEDCQPGWWPRFARNWQDSLDKARR